MFAEHRWPSDKLIRKPFSLILDGNEIIFFFAFFSEFGRLFLSICEYDFNGLCNGAYQGYHQQRTTILPAPSRISDPLAPGLLRLPTEEKKGRTPSSTFQGTPVRGPHGGGLVADRTPRCAGIQQGSDWPWACLSLPQPPLMGRVPPDRQSTGNPGLTTLSHCRFV